MYDILIIGAGVVGANIARELSKFDLDIAIIDKEADISMGATKANSAIVHGGYAESHNKLKGRICYKGRRKFKELNEELDFGFEEIGSLVLADTEEDLLELERLKENGIRNGLSDLEIIGKDEIKKLEPSIDDNIKYALHCKGAGICSPFEFTTALIENAISNGVKLFLNKEVKSIEKEGEIFFVKTNNKNFKSKIIINCAGMGSEKIANLAGDCSFNLKYKSGQYMVFNKSEGSKINKVLFQMPTNLGKGILITKTVYGNLLIGPDALQEEEVNLNTDIDRLVEIYKKSKHLTDKIDPTKIIRTFAGVRTVSNSNDFIIEKSDHIKNLINISGIQSPGLTSSPAIAEYVVEIIKKMDIDLVKNKSFNPIRKGFGNFSKKIKDKNDLICLCEEKTETEIMECFRRNIPINTIDAIKRRVRPGMGMCQGQRCKVKIQKILEEKNINLEYKTDIELKGIKRVNRFELIKILKDL